LKHLDAALAICVKPDETLAAIQDLLVKHLDETIATFVRTETTETLGIYV